MIAVLLSIALVSDPGALSRDVHRSTRDGACPCRATPDGRDYETCWLDRDPWNPYGSDHVAATSISFDAEGPLGCYYLWVGALIPSIYSAGLFPEAQAGCALPWADAQLNSMAYNSSVTISQDGRFLIPYCYGMTELHIYEIVGLPYDYTYVRSIPVPSGVDAVRFFPDHLIVLDEENIVSYSMRMGRRFTKEGQFLLPHGVFHISYAYPDVESPTWMRNMVMDGDYLYLLNSVGNDYGPLLSFKIQDNSLEMINDGKAFITPDDSYPFVFRNNLQLNESHGKKYLMYNQDACQTPYWPGGSALYRLDDNIPVVVWPPARSIACFYWDYSFKNDLYSTFAWDDYNMCPAGVYYFGEDEKLHKPGNLVANDLIYGFGMYQGPDTELLNYDGRAVGCSTDDLPVISDLLYPDRPVSENFLVMGRASDSEGIRRAFVGYPLGGSMRRAALFQQPDGTALFIAVVPEERCIGCRTFLDDCMGDNKAMVLPLAEDADGDSNQSPDALIIQDVHCITFKDDADPMPLGDVETRPCTYDSVLTFTGWAVDNSGIWQGWLFSEDAQVLIPLTVGLERPDIAALYPNDPDSLHSGFTATTNTSAIPEGEYEFTVRILANDYQVLDFGPYTIIVDHSHSRPLSKP